MKKKNVIKPALCLAFAMLLASCTAGPDYVRPSVNVPVKFKEAKGKTVMGEQQSRDWKAAHPQDDIIRGEWWEIFHDTRLNELEARLNISNQTILNAYQNYKQARALVDEARSAYFPTLAGSLGFTRQSQNTSSSSVTSALTSAGSVTGSRTSGSSSSITDSYSWLLNASWEPDIWGSVRRGVEANSAGAQASAALLASTRLSAQASLAQFYFELRGLDTDQKLLDDTVVEYRKILAFARNRYKAGVDARSDIIQAQSQLESAQAAAVNNGVLRAQYEHAIAVLIGVPPAEFSLTPYPLKATPPPIPIEVPSGLLERRPDIAQAERLMAQANAQIGVAVAAYYPALTLTGNASTVTKKLFSVPAVNWALGAELAETIFDGGLRNATVKAAEAAYCASAAAYRQTVLAAFQDVEDNLAAARILARQSVYQNQAARSARQALDLIVNQYKAGTVDYSSVLTAQITAYTAEKSAADLVYLRMTTAVGLIKALGGGWNAASIKYAGSDRIA